MNDRGQITGGYHDTAGIQHGFVYQRESGVHIRRLWVHSTTTPGVPEHSMCEDLLVSCVDNHVVRQVSVHDRGGP
jgi:hypothetical protein